MSKIKSKKNTEFLNYIIQLNSQKISSLKSTSSVVLLKKLENDEGLESILDLDYSVDGFIFFISASMGIYAKDNLQFASIVYKQIFFGIIF